MTALLYKHAWVRTDMNGEGCVCVCDLYMLLLCYVVRFRYLSMYHLINNKLGQTVVFIRLHKQLLAKNFYWNCLCSSFSSLKITPIVIASQINGATAYFGHFRHFSFVCFRIIINNGYLQLQNLMSTLCEYNSCLSMEESQLVQTAINRATAVL